MAGCASKETYPVAGNIQFDDGNKLPEGTMVVFAPSEGTTNSSYGTIDTEGNFTIDSEPGKFLVRLVAPQGDDAAEFIKTVPEPYADGNVLTVTVGTKDNNVNLEVKKK
jgi:hypothetical protein